MAKGKGSRHSADDKGNRPIVRNRKARYDYQILETLETGVSLCGSEVKSLREAKVSLIDAYAEVRDGELWLVGADIAVYPFAHQFNHEPRRRRRLLAHRHEIGRLDAKVREKGLTLVPLELYFKNGKVKVLVALAKGRREYDRRETTRQRDAARDLAEQLD
jgi:SsrA-binding protein